MKKYSLFTLALILCITSFAQNENKAAAPHCITTNVGGCWSVGIFSGCTSHTYHITVCCGSVHMNAGCWTSTWATANRTVANSSETSTVQTEVLKFANDNNLNVDLIKTFRVTNCEPFEENGILYVIKNGDYNIDKTVKGWAINEFEKIKYIPQ
jgi:hypothetical protein